jgi:hypothetical protein
MWEVKQIHLTLMKKRKEDFIPVGNIIDRFKSWNFGNLKVKSIDISTRGEFDENEFYKPLYRLNI